MWIEFNGIRKWRTIHQIKIWNIIIWTRNIKYKKNQENLSKNGSERVS